MLASLLSAETDGLIQQELGIVILLTIAAIVAIAIRPAVEPLRIVTGRLSGKPRRVAQAFIDEYFERLPKVRAWIDATIEKAREDEEVRTLYGRRRKLPELRSKDPRQKAFGERIAEARQGIGKRHGFVQRKFSIAPVPVCQKFRMKHPATRDLRPMLVIVRQLILRLRTG